MCKFIHSLKHLFFVNYRQKTIQKRQKTTKKRIKNEQKTKQKRTKNETKTNQKRPKKEPKTKQKRPKNDQKTKKKCFKGSIVSCFIFLNKKFAKFNKSKV